MGKSGSMSELFSKKQPCNNCPYRTDAPLKLWSIEEFQDLVMNDAEYLGVTYLCHKKDGSACVGWLMDQARRDLPSIALRIEMSKHDVSADFLDSLRSPAPLYDNIQQMCEANFPEMIKFKIIQYNRFELYYKVDHDLERFPLPICMNEDEERKQMGLRTQRVKRLVDRFLSIHEIRTKKILQK
jgi:hypothetical protein